MLIDEKEAARRLNIGVRSLQRERAEGRLNLPFVRVGLRRVAYDSDAIEKWIAARTHRSLAEERTRNALRGAGK